MEYQDEPERPALAAAYVTLDELPVTPRAARAMIARGELPATKRGRCYLVLRADVERVFAPTTRTAEAAPANDSDDAIIERLRRRGIRVEGAQ